MYNTRHLIIVVVLFFTKAYCATISGCPEYGCRPSGTFSYLINLPSKEPKVIWNTTYEAIPNCLGCVGNINNIVCPYKGPKSDGYVSIDSNTGKQVWYDGVLHNPSLPVMDIEGDIIGTDGHYMVKYEADGTEVKPAKPVEAVLYPLYSVQIADNGILLFASMSGILFSMDTAGIPHASICLNGTVERSNGTFIPVTTPIIVGNRAFILTEFKPDENTPETRQPNILGMQRLYAIDIFLRMVDRLHIAWVFDFEEERSAVKSLENGKIEDKLLRNWNDKTLRFKPKRQEVQGDPLIMANVQDEIIHVILPAPESNSNMPRLFWAIKDGDNPTLLYKRTISASRMSMYEVNGSSKRKPIRFATEKKLLGNTAKSDSRKQFSKEIPVWLLAESRNVIYKVASMNGSIDGTFNLTSILDGEVEVTSDIMVSREADDSIDNVIFGASVLNKDKIAQNYVVSMNSTGIIQWKVQTPMNVCVIGQIAGIAAEGLNSDDLLVAFGNNKDGSSSVFGIQ